MMSDWKVELVEDNISEFYVEFGGPKDSECNVLKGVAALTSNHPVSSRWQCGLAWLAGLADIESRCRPVRRRGLEAARGATRCIPLQVTIYRLCEQDLPPKRG
jgi:hypothetical protein